ncbi:MAG: zinc ribbon domain-containing protein [Pseudomonadota bacterium]
MPVYEYRCEEHGPFEAMRPMSECSAPYACPVCGRQAPRVMLSAPNVANMGSEKRFAQATNERSADSPKKLSTHGPDGSRGKTPGQRALHRADGAKSFPSSRPWMLSH